MQKMEGCGITRSVSAEGQVLAYLKLAINQSPNASAQRGEFQYSNAGYAIAGAMVEVATGFNFREAVENGVFEPLGITASADGGWPALNDARQAFGHYTLGGKSVPHPPDHEYQLDSFMLPAGDLSLSILEYAAFLQMNLRALLEEVFPEEEVRWRHQAQNGDGPGAGWMLGSAAPFGRYSLHNGSAGTFVAGAFVFPDRDRVAAVLINSGDRDAHRECLQMVNRKFVADLQP